MLDPSELNRCLKKLSQQFVILLQNNDSFDKASKKMAKQAQKLVQHLQHSPETAHFPDVIEILQLFAGVGPLESPAINNLCSTIIKSFFRVLPTTELSDIFNITPDISLCCYICEWTAIDSDLFFEKLCTFVENPNLEDISWFMRFVKMIKCPITENIRYQTILPFALYLTDNSPLRSTLAFLVLNTFSKINQHVAIMIVSAWLMCENKNPIISNHCRLILQKAPLSTLNMLATLSFDLLQIFSILPSNIKGYKTATLINLHRINTFYPEKVSEFLRFCDPVARDIIHHDSSTKLSQPPNLVINETNIPKELQLYDTSIISSRSRNSIAKMMDTEITINFLSSALLFARTFPHENAAFVPAEINEKICQGLQAQCNTNLKKIPCSEYHAQEIKDLADLIESCNISELIKKCNNGFH